MNGEQKAWVLIAAIFASLLITISGFIMNYNIAEKENLVKLSQQDLTCEESVLLTQSFEVSLKLAICRASESEVDSVITAYRQ